MHLETSCFQMTARKQYFPTIYVATSQTLWLLFRLFSKLFPIIRNIWLHLFSFTICTLLCIRYRVKRSLSHLDMAIHVHEHSIRDSTCSVRIGRDVTIVAALYLSCRRFARGMCSINTSSFFVIGNGQSIHLADVAHTRTHTLTHTHLLAYPHTHRR